jgi:hypothetical protein
MTFDTYIARAWVLPVVLLITPLIAGAVALGVLGSSTKATGVAGMILFAVAMVAATVIRSRGRDLQHRMWATAGGAPTVRALRHRGSTPADVLARRHARLAELTGIAAPSAEAEAGAPAVADRIYAEWVDWIIGATRDERVVHSEVIQYGFLRNTAAIRRWGMGVALAVAGASILSLVLLEAKGAVLPAAVGIGMFIVWWKLLNEDAAERQSRIYADALFRAMPAVHPAVPA